MGFLDSWLPSEERQKCLYLKDDYKGELLNLPIRRKMVVQEKGDEVIQAWPYDPRLRIRLHLNGKDYGVVFPIANRNAIFDPLEITGDDLKRKNLLNKMHSIAGEEFRFARSKKLKDVSEKATYPLAIGAAVLVVGLVLMTLYQVYV